MPWSRLALAALAFGLWAGLAELIPFYVAPLGKVLVRVSPDVTWMTPLADVILLGLVAAAVLVVRRLWPRVGTRPVATGIFAAVATVALGLGPERLHPLAILLLGMGIGTQVARMTRPEPRRTWILPASAGAAALVVMLLTGAAKWEARAARADQLAALPAAPHGAPNVLLLILDTVRGASLNFMTDPGQASPWPPVRTPTLDVVADQSVVFENAVAPSPWTLPSHASMFTGQWPSNLSAGWREPLDGQYPTIAEVFARHGYLTTGVVGNLLFASRETGLARGFQYYEDYPVSPGQVLLSCSIGRRLAASSRLRRLLGAEEIPNRVTAAQVTDRFLDWQSQHGDRPFFGFLNYFDAHEPYFPPDSVRRQIPPGTDWNDYLYYTGILTGAGARRNDKWAMNRTEEWVHASSYHAAILRVDREVGRLLTELDARGVLENTVLVIAADHGEQLGEHGLFEHQNSLYRTALHVPLLVHVPGGSPGGTRVPEAVSLRDLGATLLDLSGIDPESAGIGGRSLARYWQERGGHGPPGAGVAPPASDTIFSILRPRFEDEERQPRISGAVMVSLSNDAFHYIVNVDGAEELYDVRQDPGELRNLVELPSSEAVLMDFRAELEGVMRGTEPAPTAAGGGPDG